MNYAIVFRLLSYILFCEAALLLLPLAVSVFSGEACCRFSSRRCYAS